MSPSLIKALVKRTRRPERVQANAPLASRAIFKRTSQPEGDVHEDQPASSSSHVDNIISHSSAALKIMEGLSDLAGIPALKVVSGALARFLELVDQMRKNKDDYIEFALSVFETIRGAKDELVRFQESLTDLENFVKAFGDLETELLEMVYDAERLMNQSLLKKVWSTSTTKDTLRKYQDRLNRKMTIFTMRNTMVSRLQIEIANVEESIFGDYAKVILGQMELLDKLPRAKIMKIVLPCHEQGSDYSVRISDERKTARFYEGTDGIKRLKEELEVISRFRHPQIGQLYGICKSNRHPALIFHQEMRSIEPYYNGNAEVSSIESVYFIYKCIRAFINARDYLISQYELLRIQLNYGVYINFAVNLSDVNYALGMDMRLAHDGRIMMLLSVTDPLPADMVDGAPIVDSLRATAWPIHKIYTTEVVGCSTSVALKHPTKIKDKLNEFHSVLFEVGQSSFSYIGHEDLGTIRCRRTVKWGTGIISYSNPLDFTPAARIARVCVEPVGSPHKIDFEIIGKWIKFTVPCFTTSDGIFRFTIAPDMRDVGNTWVSQMAYAFDMLERRFTHLRSYGSQSVELLYPSYVTYSFQAEFTAERRRAMDLPSKIYLFVSFQAATGGRIVHEWYWSWHNNGVGRLTRRERIQAGIMGNPCLEASVKTERISWGPMRMRAIRSLHASCGFRSCSRDAARALGLPLIRLASKEKLRSRSASPKRAHLSPSCTRRSSFDSPRSDDLKLNLFRRNGKYSSEDAYWTVWPSSVVYSQKLAGLVLGRTLSWRDEHLTRV